MAEELIYSQSIGFNLGIESVRAKVLGQLAVLADPKRMIAYQGDLYHDATWLRDHLDFTGWANSQSVVFWYGTRETGTSITNSHTLIGSDNDTRYKVAVIRKNVTRRGEPDFRYDLQIARLD